jgi:hypothetical protein
MAVGRTDVSTVFAFSSRATFSGWAARNNGILSEIIEFGRPPEVICCCTTRIQRSSLTTSLAPSVANHV